MKKSIMKKWVAALRSGDYVQGRGALRNDFNEFCCLGVLCNLHTQVNPEAVKMNTNPEAYFDETGILPEVVQHWAGMKNKVGQIKSEQALTIMNDSGDWDFNQIADFIEQNYAKL